jgi:hypothetical protein
MAPGVPTLANPDRKVMALELPAPGAVSTDPNSFLIVKLVGAML